MKNTFNNLIEVTQYFSDKQRCIDYLTNIRWNGNVTCAHCNHTKVYELKGATKRYKCASCRKQFSATKGTIFENSPISLQKWFVAPSNPHFGRWEKIDKKIKEQNLTSYREIQENKKKDQSIKIDEETEDKFYMAEDGYGNGTVVGEVNGEETTVSTAEKGRHIKKQIPSDVSTNEDLLVQFFDITQQILKRVKDHNPDVDKWEDER